VSLPLRVLVRGAFRGGGFGGFLAAHRPFFIGLHVHRVTPTAGIQQHGFLHLFFVMFLPRNILRLLQPLPFS